MRLRVEFNIFGRFGGVASELYAACMNAKFQGRLTRIRFLAGRELNWLWDDFAMDPEWFKKAFPLRDFVFWDGAKFKDEVLRDRLP